MLDNTVDCEHSPKAIIIESVYNRRCIEAGKHVITEHPLATNAEDVAILQRLAKKKGILLFDRCSSENN